MPIRPPCPPNRIVSMPAIPSGEISIVIAQALHAVTAGAMFGTPSPLMRQHGPSTVPGKEHSMNDRVTITIEDGIADVRLNRADKMNALDPAMFAGLNDAIGQLAGMQNVRVAVLSGEGRAFCAGLDMASMAGGGSGNDLGARSHGLANTAQNVAWGWRQLPMPVIAAIHGVAMGGGFQVLSGADIRIAHPATRMSIRETYWGLVPDMAGVALWRTLAR